MTRALVDGLAVHARRLAKGDRGQTLLPTILNTLFHEGAAVESICTLLTVEAALTRTQLTFLDAAEHADVIYAGLMAWGCLLWRKWW
mmetsp:Transcript_47563/g.99150  ORF Transcript_47563/g.99150 Transcript_47563/m.99150 type:complete len:87 (+) Transcript_47563:937-1197(+)